MNVAQLPPDPPITREAVRDLEHRTFTEYRISSRLVMELAGAGAARVGLNMLTSFGPVGEAKVVLKGNVVPRSYEQLAGMGVIVLAGPGNNGGDGFVVARHLHQFGADVLVLLLCPRSSFRPDSDAGHNLDLLEPLGVMVREMTDADTLQSLHEMIRAASLVVDAMFGIGLNRPLSEPYLTAVDIINTCTEMGHPVLAIDIPTGLDANTGAVHGAAVMASDTATFGAIKRGMTVGEGPKHVGRLHLIPVGFPRHLLAEAHAQAPATSHR